jgi:hypothetical protein
MISNVDEMRAVLRRRGLHITLSDAVRPDVAALFLDRSERTLRTWRSTGRGPEFVGVQGRIYYPITALFRFVEEGRDRPGCREPSRIDLDVRPRSAHHRHMHVSSSRLTTNLPSAVAARIRELAADQGIGVGELLAASLRAYAPVVNALADTDTTREPNDTPS